ncbi:MAG: alpha-amylase family protein [Anaerolineae bacterium]
MANWWQEKPIRLVQTNLREIDARRDPREIVREAKDFGANAILFSVGGIVSFYPSSLEYQTLSPYIAGQDFVAQDFVGQGLDEAKKLGLRFIARLDLSKAHRHVYEAHPEWFFRRWDGKPQIYNGLYSTCVNGGYYQKVGFEIMQEVRDRYDVDAFFFNMFGYHSTDYSGNDHGLCQCENCQRRFREMFDRLLPQKEDWSDPAYLDYIEFKRLTADDLTRRVADFIHQQPNVALVNYQVQFADVVRSESNSAVDRPLPMWQLSGSDNVKRVRGTYPGKPSANTAVYFVDIPYRFASVSPHQTALRLAQDLCHGGDIDLYVLGTLDQEDKMALPAAREIYQFARAHEAALHGWRSLAKTLLLYPQRSFDYGKSSAAAYRGMFRLLSENHILFDSAHDFILDQQDADAFLAKVELLVLPGAACLSDAQLAAIDRFVENGGRVLATGETALYTELGRPRDRYGLDCLGAGKVRFRRDDMRSAYFRVHNTNAVHNVDAVHDRDAMGPLAGTGLLFLDERYLYTVLKEGATTSLTLVPPCTYGPPEKCFIDKIESDPPGVIGFAHGAGRSAYLPWMIDSLYYRHSAPGHERLLASLLRDLLPDRQIETDANPQVEFALFSHSKGFTLNLVNTSGHHGTAFFPPVTMHDVQVKIRLPATASSAFSLKLQQPLDLVPEGEHIHLTLPRLELFDLIEIT